MGDVKVLLLKKYLISLKTFIIICILLNNKSKIALSNCFSLQYAWYFWQIDTFLKMDFRSFDFQFFWNIDIYLVKKAILTYFQIPFVYIKNRQESIKFSVYLKFLNQPYKKWSLEKTGGTLFYAEYNFHKTSMNPN